jgi:hypothetical protein
MRGKEIWDRNSDDAFGTIFQINKYSILKKQAEIFHYNFSLLKNEEKKSFAHVQKILISFY